MPGPLSYDVLALDLDGTLLDSQHALPAENRAALHRAHRAGLKIVLCTGRAFTETRPVIDEIGLDLDAAVTVFGALVTDVASGRSLYRTPIPPVVAREVADWFRAEGFAVCWLTDPTEAGSDGFVLDGPRRHPAVDRWIAWSPCVVQNVADLPADGPAPLRLSIIDELAVLTDVSQRLHRAFDGRLTHNILHAPPYELSLIEVFAPEVNKWYGIQKLLDAWQFVAGRTVAIGDDVNDVDMIREAGLGVAMSNARASVSAVADRVTGTNDACGVAQVIDELLDPG